MIKIIDNCCVPAYLDCLKEVAVNSANWNMYFPGGASIDEKHLKLNIIRDGIKHPILAGLAIGLLIQIHQAGGQDLFIPEINQCSISIKDKHTPEDIMHKEYEGDRKFVKILGIINDVWKEEWGGGIFCNEKSNYIQPTSFCIFDPSESHSAEEIFTDKKRFAIDFTVIRDRQALERRMKKFGNKYGNK